MGSAAKVGVESSQNNQVQNQSGLSGAQVQNNGQSRTQMRNNGQSDVQTHNNGQSDIQMQSNGKSGTQNNGQSGDAWGDSSGLEGPASGKGKKTARDKSPKKEKKSKPAEQTLDTSQLLKKKDGRNI